MNKYVTIIEVRDGQLQEIMEEMHKAQETILDCYHKLQNMGVVTVRKAASENADGSGTLKLKDGTTLNYSGVRKMTATAYTSGVNGVGTRTASGTKVHVGTVAVDRSVIPLGTRMYIVAGSKVVYGLAVAEDTGVRGDKIDLYYDTYDECIQFGRRTCTVYILE